MLRYCSFDTLGRILKECLYSPRFTKLGYLTQLRSFLWGFIKSLDPQNGSTYSQQKTLWLSKVHTPPSQEVQIPTFCLQDARAENKWPTEDSCVVLFILIKSLKEKTIIHGKSVRNSPRWHCGQKIKSHTSETTLCLWPTSEKQNDCYNIMLQGHGNKIKPHYSDFIFTSSYSRIP